MPRKPHKYHFIYKTTCTVNNKFYVGMHSTSNLDDGYMGSGKVIRRSLIKYGKAAHIFEILEFKENRESIRLREREIVNEDLLKDPLCMNIHLGGVGFEEHSQKSKEQISRGLRKPYIEIYGEEEATRQREKRSLKAKEQWKNTSEEKKNSIKDKISKSVKNHNELFPQTLEKLTCPHCNVTGKGNSMLRHHFNKCPSFTGESRKGHVLSQAAKDKLSAYFKGRPCESRRGIPPSNKGTKSERTTCPHCNKDVAVTVKNRHHFDNCKFK